ncbi:hypothetical protein Pmani_014831 [Petrolisthes manimaculis]|uniref:Gag-pol polyprotein n=1 Tax=Petrolisthes manimaculis TaxID=1843537 RepID=A0AAE1PS21_9EUCA|nr:hypothetical protein Pmani_014831 [Petrolisthes manimaculis]
MYAVPRRNPRSMDVPLSSCTKWVHKWKESQWTLLDLCHALIKGTGGLLHQVKTRTTPLRLQSDGMVEKFNWTLGQELAKYCVEGQSEWDEKLPSLLMAYRSAAYESTDYTPAKLMLGHELRFPVDVLMGRPPEEDLPTYTSSYAKHLQERLAEVQHQVRKSLRFSDKVMKSRYDAKANEVNFWAGDNFGSTMLSGRRVSHQSCRALGRGHILCWTACLT